MNIAFRISLGNKELTPVWSQIKCEKLVVYEHKAARLHVHGLVINCELSTDTLKNYVKRAIGVTSFPKSDWSFKTLHEGHPVDDKFIIYMSKGSLQPCYVNGYTIDDLELYRTQWVDKPKKELIQYKIKVENPQTAKIRQNELMDIVKAKCKERNVRQPRDILEVIREVVYKQHKTIVGRYKIRDYYDYVVSDINPQSWLDNMEKLISFREL